MMNKKLLIASVGVAFLLTACPTVHSPLSEISKSGKWMDIGVSTNSNVRHEIDKNSIRKSSNVVTFRDRKTIDDLSKNHFSSLPEHKTSVNTWEINCRNQTFSILAIQLFDKAGNSVFKEDYSSQRRTPKKVTRGSSVEKQYEYVCK